MKKCLLFTFDYELFLGARSGLVHDCMIEPTEKLIDVFDEYKVKAIFFVDTTYLSRLKEKVNTHKQCALDFDSIVHQIQQLIRKGHYVYPHIHPHWIDAEYNTETNQWSLNDVTHYRFHNVNDTLKEKIFHESMEVLHSIIHPADPNYKINGFRAGGWSLQPFTDFKPFFDKYNIIYDFSVLPRTYQLSDVQYFDFSNSPTKPVYRFEDDVTVENQEGKYTELVSSIIKVSTFTEFINRLYLQYLYRVKNDHTYGKGQGQHSNDIPEMKPVSEQGTSIRNTRFQPISMETFNRIKVPVYLNYLKNNTYMQFVSHPKMLSNHNVKTVARFLEMVTKKYGLEFDFQSFINNSKGSVN